MSISIRVAACILVGLAWAMPASAAPRPAKRAPAVQRVAGVPILPEVAIQAWQIKARANETTESLHKRTSADIRKLFQKSRDKITSADGGWWRTINYLRLVPYSQLPEPWKQWVLANVPNARLTDDQRADMLRRLESKALWKMTPKEAEVWISSVHESTPALRDRVVAIARKNLGQPYRMYLLGEYPYEIHDADPTLDLSHGDCVVFSEHTYSMALSPDWNTFYRTLQRLRYKNGEVGMTTRNHYTVADWNRNNGWLVEDITRELGASTVTVYRERVDRSKFFANFGIGQDIPVETIEDAYIPHSALPEVVQKLQPGDFVNVVRGKPNGGAWVGHVGLIGKRPDGTTTFIHSTPPKSVEVPILEYISKGAANALKNRKKDQPEFLGLKFLRLRESPQVPKS